MKKKSNYLFIVYASFFLSLLSFIYSNISLQGWVGLVLISTFAVYHIINEEFNLANIYFIFPLVMYFYTLFFVLLKFSLNLIEIDLIRISEFSYNFGAFICICILTIYILIFNVFKNSFSNSIRKICINLKEEINSKQLNKTFWIFDAISFVILFAILVSFMNNGGLGFILDGGSRLEISEKLRLVNNSYLKYYFLVYSLFIYISYFRQVYTFNFKAINRQSIDLSMLTRTFIIVFYWVLSFIAGNRREFVYMFLISLIIFIVYRFGTRKIPLKLYILSSFPLITLLTMGYFRNFNANRTPFLFSKFILDTFGDFVFPIQTLYYYIDHPKLMLGKSYVNTFLYYIPRAFYNEKPISLANQFVLEINSRIGYGFSIVTESYLNFGWLSTIILPILILLIISLVVVFSKNDSILYFLFFSQVLNLNRGEFGVSILEYSILIFFYLIMKYINGFEIPANFKKYFTSLIGKKV